MGVRRGLPPGLHALLVRAGLQGAPVVGAGGVAMPNGDAGLVLDPAGGAILDVDLFLTALLGYAREELLGKTLWAAGPFRDASWRRISLSCLQEQESLSYQDLPLETKDGRTIRVALSGSQRLLDGDGGRQRVICCTFRKIQPAEDPPIPASESYQLACRAARVAVWDWDAQKRRLVWDEQMYELCGVRKDSSASAFRVWLNGLHPDDRARAREEVRAALNGESRYESEFRIVRPDGTIRDLRSRGAALRDEDGRPLRMVGVTFDVTEQKRAEIAHCAARQYAEDLIENVNAMVVVLDALGRVRGFNKAAERITGYTRHEIEGSHWFETLVPKKRYPQVWEAFDRLAAGELPSDFENPILTKAGAERHIVWQNSVVREQDKIAGVVSCGIDVTERKRAEEALAQERTLLNYLMTTIPDNIYFKDRQSRFIRVNEALAQRFGLSDPGEAIGKTDADFFREEHARQAYADEQRVMTNGQPLLGLEERETWPDGHITWASTSKVPIRDAGGQVVGLVGVSRDITERKTLEARFRQTQKMEAVGRLAGGVAHDFNNQLGVVIGCCEAVMKRLDEKNPLRAKQAEILKAAHRAADLVQQLLAFSRRQVLQPEALDLNDVVAASQTMLRGLIGENVELTTLLEPELGNVWADPRQVSQIIMNLGVNARDAMPAGGRLLIETSNVELDEAYVTRHPGARPGRYVMLALSDTGSGMNREVQAHLFEPFFTTKAPGKGTGLGLATVYGIVKQSDGYVSAYSELGVGSTFKIYLPRINAPAPATSVHGEEQIAPPAGGTETVLLVEDEPSLRNAVRDSLEDNGYVVLAAGDGAAALQVADEHAGPIHLMVTDVIMPGMTGREAAGELLRFRPEMKVLYVSGYTQEAIVRHGDFGPGTVFLSKPFTSEALLRKCRELLDESGNPRVVEPPA